MRNSHTASLPSIEKNAGRYAPTTISKNPFVPDHASTSSSNRDRGEILLIILLNLGSLSLKVSKARHPKPENINLHSHGNPAHHS